MQINEVQKLNAYVLSGEGGEAPGWWCCFRADKANNRLSQLTLPNLKLIVKIRILNTKLALFIHG